MHYDCEYDYDIPFGVRRILEILEHADYEAYIVGGCVRDKLLGKEPHDWDICTSASPELVQALMTGYRIKTIETGLKHGTITARLDDENYEITTFRIDGEYSDNRRPDSVEFTDDIVADLARRDFTINAMAGDIAGDLIDPFNGEDDLRLGLIRCVRDPDARFKEDGLRIMRALRFASTYGFRIEENTAAAIHRNKDLLKNISAERIRSELCKLLVGEGALDILLEYKDVIAVIIPELEPCIGFNQNNPYHKYDVYDHIVYAVYNYRGTDISIKMALLLHDIGKPECYTEDHNGGHFHGHSVPSMRIAKDVMSRLKFDNKTRDEVIDLVLYHDSDIYPGGRSVKRWLNKIGPEMLNKLIYVKIADICAHSENNQRERLDRILCVKLIAKGLLAEKQCFTIHDLAVNGHDILSLGVETGPIVGKVLNHLLELLLDGDIDNDRDELIREAHKFLEENK